MQYTKEDLEILRSMVSPIATTSLLKDAFRDREDLSPDNFIETLERVNRQSSYYPHLLGTVEHVLAIPLEDVPLYTHIDTGSVSVIVRWRLSIGK